MTDATGALRVVSLAERPDLRGALDDHQVAAWPAFMLEDEVANRLWHRLGDDFAAWQLLLLDDERVVVGGNSAPFAWDGTDEGLPEGWDDQLERTVAGMEAGVSPTALGALQIVVAPDRRGEGLAGRMVEAFRERARAACRPSSPASARPTSTSIRSSRSSATRPGPATTAFRSTRGSGSTCGSARASLGRRRRA